jgi:hypothetical protein
MGTRTVPSAAARAIEVTVSEPGFARSPVTATKCHPSFTVMIPDLSAEQGAD